MDVPHIIAGRFRIECEIGKGGMGTVYRATHLGLERPVAVKIIKPEFAFDPDVTERFMREARTMARLRHPHAAMIFDAGILPDNRHFIVMEYVEGATLAEILQRESRFAPQRAVQIASSICDVLAEAHHLGIVHRDLKPSNVMMGERGVCVLDFGVAKVLATSAEVTVTHSTTGSGVIIGTPRYMSPEQCLGHRVEARSDLYSLGVLLYEMLAGRPPFMDALSSAVLIKQATAAPPPLMALRPDVPRALALAVHTLLAKRPEDRPKTASAARVMLEKSVARAPRSLPETQPFASTVATINARRPIIFRAFAPVAALVLCSALILTWERGGQSAPETLAPDDVSPSKTITRAQAAPFNATRDSALSSSFGATIAPASFSPLPSLDEARHIVGAVSHNQITDVCVLRTPHGGAIAAIDEGHRAGASNLFVMEPRRSAYRVTNSVPLDAVNFHATTWTAQTLDADGDGYDEVLCTGASLRGRAKNFRLALYVPRTQQLYALQLESDARRIGSWHAVWSTNATARRAASYRALLKQTARSLIAAR